MHKGPAEKGDNPRALPLPGESEGRKMGQGATKRGRHRGVGGEEGGERLKDQKQQYNSWRVGAAVSKALCEGRRGPSQDSCTAPRGDGRLPSPSAGPFSPLFSSPRLPSDAVP